MSEMVKRVAKLIALEAIGSDYPIDAPLDGKTRSLTAAALARAAIMAMREPTAEMVDSSYYEDAASLWRHMIDAALGTPKNTGSRE